MSLTSKLRLPKTGARGSSTLPVDWPQEARANIVKLNAVSDLLRMPNADLLLMAGEMSAQELRTVRAVLDEIRVRAGLT